MKPRILFVCDDCGVSSDDWIMNCSCGSSGDSKSYFLCNNCDKYHYEKEKCKCKGDAQYV